MVAGTVLVLGPYAINSASIAGDLSSSGGAIVKNVTSWQDKENKFVWFAVCQEA